MAAPLSQSCLASPDITQTAKLGADIWLIGTVVHLREIQRSPTEGNNEKIRGRGKGRGTVSYTHLTLPTILRV